MGIDKDRVIAVLGGKFNYNPTWIEKIVKEAAEDIVLEESEEIPPTFYFDEENRIVGEKRFSGRGKDTLSLNYSRYLPLYNIKSENSKSQETIKEASELFTLSTTRALNVLLNYFIYGPYSENLYIINYKSLEHTERKSEFGIARYLERKGGSLEEKIVIRVGVNNEQFKKFIKHLRKSQIPEAVYFAGAFEKREKAEKGEDIAHIDLCEYLEPDPNQIRSEEYQQRIKEFALFVTDF